MHHPRQQLNWKIDPLMLIRKWPADRRLVVLHSGRLHPQWSRYTLIAQPAGSYRFIIDPQGQGFSQWLPETDNHHLIPQQIRDLPTQFTHHPFKDLRLLTQCKHGKWVGYLSYDLGRWVEKLPFPGHHPINAPQDRWPIIEFAWCPGYLLYDQQENKWHTVGQWEDDFHLMLPNCPDRASGFNAENLQSVFTQKQYLAAVERVKEYIAAGDVFQVNLTQRLSADFTSQPYPLAQRAIFNRLAYNSPAWYGAYLELACQSVVGDTLQRTLISTSPELFLDLDQNRRVTTRPIKGTRPADISPDDLLNSEKDTAELNMIVDLMRNDLGRVCSYASVKVEQPRTIETHPTIHHGVATITGKLHERYDLVDLLHATMPGGSITGAPKVRTMQIIDELEPVNRGPYCGCIGHFNEQQATFNIAIRTIMAQSIANQETGQLQFAVGGGIVADSNPLDEYFETLDKASAILKTLNLI